ncbi:polysaccharide biosynthesis/export family protein [Thermomonas sp.]|uniref:polysaccharide biosynthesis/export family protein n=1 Tax=Thermomonas sp. TaxID=1971895 RepID=UPI00248801E8|nr:polysaccharide biosynthesis/export family protein [Thermomonas sp.]MDI1253534.1 polysaccharide export protein [Thermomonas sp.]
MKIAIVFVLCWLLVACANGGGPRPSAIKGDMPAPDSTTTSGAYEGATDYRVGALDLLAITVFGVDELTKEVRVNSKGQISLPLIGTMVAGGMTVPALESELAKRYAQGYLQHPQVTVFVKDFASQRITMDGAIKKPGIIALTGKTSLLQAIAMAGGVDEKLADLGGIVLMRQVDGKRMAARFDLRAIRRGTVTDPQLYGDDVIIVEQSGSKTAMHRFLESLPLLGVFTLLP